MHALLALVCLASPVDPGRQDALPGDAPALAERRVASELFAFRSRFWVNLHHFLYEQALLSVDPPRSNGTSGTLASIDDTGDTGNTGDARESWLAAVEHYGMHWIGRDLLFDPELDALDALLGAEPEESDLEELYEAGVDTELLGVLEMAAPIYREHFWSEHDAANRRWIEEMRAPLETVGARVADELAAAFQAPWPERAIDVDVVVFANWAGAYTSRPAHVRIRGTSEVERGRTGLELLFHEASHLLAGDLIGRTARAIEGAASAGAELAPRVAQRLWHYVLFHTAGEVVRRVWKAETDWDYVPYPERNGIWSGERMGRVQRALDRHWLPYLNGEAPFDEALGRVVTALAE